MKIYDIWSINDIDDSLTYSDIGILPIENSTLEHRAEADTRSVFLEQELKIPVLSSPMESVTGIEMAIAGKEYGILPVLNRFDDSMRILSESPLSNVAISLGLNDSLSVYEQWRDLINPIICIDTANAQNNFVLRKVEAIRHALGNIRLIVGNIAYTDCMRGSILWELDHLGVNAVRVGIGNGSACSTSVRTGIGIGQVSSISSCYLCKAEQNLKISLIADGGISSVGDICKALALGADTVMLGRMLSGTRETPGNVIKNNGELYKIYRGSASFGVKQSGKYVEGEETLVPYKGSVINVFESISDGIQSCMAYVNARTLQELREKSYFVKLSQSSYLERLPKV